MACVKWVGGPSQLPGRKTSILQNQHYSSQTGTRARTPCRKISGQSGFGHWIALCTWSGLCRTGKKHNCVTEWRNCWHLLGQVWLVNAVPELFSYVWLPLSHCLQDASEKCCVLLTSKWKVWGKKPTKQKTPSDKFLQ